MLHSYNFCHPYLDFLWCLQLWPKDAPREWLTQPFPSHHLSPNGLDSQFPYQGFPSLPQIRPPIKQNKASLSLEEEEVIFTWLGEVGRWGVVKSSEKIQVGLCKASAVSFYFGGGVRGGEG